MKFRALGEQVHFKNEQASSETSSKLIIPVGIGNTINTARVLAVGPKVEGIKVDDVVCYEAGSKMVSLDSINGIETMPEKYFLSIVE